MFGATDVITVLGRRGSGKTTLSQKIQKAYPRLVIFDRLHEYNPARGDFEVFTFEEFSDAVRKTLGLRKFRIIFRFDIEADNHSEVFNQALRVLYYRGSLCLVVEEVHNFASAHFLPQWFREVLLTGRHRGLALIATSQRPAELHKTLLSQCHHIFCGILHEKNDVNYLYSVMGETADLIPKLKPYTFVQFTPGFPAKIVRN